MGAGFNPALAVADYRRTPLSYWDDPNRRQAIREENRKLRYLRFLVDLALAEIRAGSFTLAQA